MPPEKYDVPAAIDAADAARRPLVTTGRQSVGHYLSAWAEKEIVLRIVEPLTDPAPPAWTVLRSRGPYDLPGERELMREQRADHLVTKDSGGTFTAPKLEAAAELGIPVVVVARPDPVVGVEQRTDVESADYLAVQPAFDRDVLELFREHGTGVELGGDRTS